MSHCDELGDVTALPRKAHKVRLHLANLTIWNDLRLHDGGMAIMSRGMSGTTRTQQIVSQFLRGAAEHIGFIEISPWGDFRISAAIRLTMLEVQTHLCSPKMHPPADALRISPLARCNHLLRSGVSWASDDAPCIHKEENSCCGDVLTAGDCAGFEAYALVEIHSNRAEYLKTGRIAPRM